MSRDSVQSPSDESVGVVLQQWPGRAEGSAIGVVDSPIGPALDDRLGQRASILDEGEVLKSPLVDVFRVFPSHYT